MITKLDSNKHLSEKILPSNFFIINDNDFLNEVFQILRDNKLKIVHINTENILELLQFMDSLIKQQGKN